MRKLFLINALILLTLVSCSTISTAEQTQISNSAILLAEAYNSSGSYSQALEVYDKALNSVSDYRLYYNKAATLAHLERYDEALELCRSSFEKYPEIISFKKLELSILQLCSTTEEIIICSKEILELDPADTEVLLTMMEAYSDSGSVDEAYSVALNLFNRKVTDNRVLTVLKEYDEETWAEAYNLLFTTTEEKSQ